MTDGAKPTPPVPSPMPAGGPGGTWAIIVGAIFGAITLMGLFIFAYLAAQNPNFICSTFTLLAPIFALGCALSAGFIGGAAAANGNLGAAAQNNTIAFTAGGGIAVLFIAFFAFQSFKPDCSARTELHFRNFPTELRHLSKDFWIKREDDSGWSKSQLRVLVEQKRQGFIEFVGQQGTGSAGESCRLFILMTDSRSHNFEQEFPEIRIVKLAALDRDFQLEYRKLIVKNSLKAKDPSCFTYRSRSIVGSVIVSTSRNEILSGDKYNAEFEENASFDSFTHQDLYRQISIADYLGSSLITHANAEEKRPVFADIRDRLRTGNDALRVTTRQYLSGNFSNYSDEVLADLFQKEQDQTNYYAALLSAVIAGIESSTKGALTPGKHRDLSTKLPYVNGREWELILLTAHPSDEVKKQARRLIQRFPVDAFDKYYSKIIESASDGKCSESTTSKISSPVIYSAIFYYYNRVIQRKYTQSISDGEVKQLDSIASKIKSAARNCLSADLYIDAAVIDYGRAIVYSENKAQSRKGNAIDAAKSFLNFVSGKSDDYYYQLHVDAMRQLSGT
ncbi:MAG: hypothetical protein K2X71_10930 [Methylobacterium sp.]|uniref:hypothetical protein n=1 Tax=Methylobacterium sp. TaxID=409 RepID=UPI00258F5B3C|nr:hypothetical protein [Methylobacterium sp.]MBY0296538.1 hypothetical protein [Methylobacterium sp.]